MSDRQVIRISDEMAQEFAKIESDLIQARRSLKEAVKNHTAIVARIKERRTKFWQTVRASHQIADGKSFSVQLRQGRATLVERQASTAE